MKNYIWRLAAAVILAGTFFLLIQTGLNALAQGPETVYVSSPAEGETVSGLITVTGAVDFPNFLKYEVFLRSGKEMPWVATSYAPVINGNLARLDTRIFPDGPYQLVIRQVGGDSNYTEFAGPAFTIQNGLGAPLPYPEIESSFLYSPLTGEALLRIKNCAGQRLEFDYVSDEGFCSAQDLWIEAKAEDSPICPSVDVLLKPCEYRGTAVGEGEKRAATYMFRAEAGKIYQFDYAGDARFFLGEVAGDKRAETDTGGLAPDDPARPQTPPETFLDVTGAPEPSPDTADQPAETSKAEPAPATSNAESDSTLLPVSGQGRASNLPFIGIALSLILFLIIGGFLAARKRGYRP